MVVGSEILTLTSQVGGVVQFNLILVPRPEDYLKDNSLDYHTYIQESRLTFRKGLHFIVTVMYNVYLA